MALSLSSKQRVGIAGFLGVTLAMTVVGVSMAVMRGRLATQQAKAPVSPVYSAVVPNGWKLATISTATSQSLPAGVRTTASDYYFDATRYTAAEIAERVGRAGGALQTEGLLTVLESAEVPAGSTPMLLTQKVQSLTDQVNYRGGFQNQAVEGEVIISDLLVSAKLVRTANGNVIYVMGRPGSATERVVMSEIIQSIQ
jgi:hypothetical protein